MGINIVSVIIIMSDHEAPKNQQIQQENIRYRGNRGNYRGRGNYQSYNNKNNQENENKSNFIYLKREEINIDTDIQTLSKDKPKPPSEVIFNKDVELIDIKIQDARNQLAQLNQKS